VLVDKLGLRIAPQQQAEVVKPGDNALKFDAVNEKYRHGHLLFANMVEEGVLQVLHLFTGHCWPLV
jgi:hypothetical protein